MALSTPAHSKYNTDNDMSYNTITHSHGCTQQPEQKMADRAHRGHNPNCPKAKYTNRAYLNTGTMNANGTSLAGNAFGNGWSDEGRKRYCEMMHGVNESRAFYNTSFNRRMKKFAVNFQLTKQRKRIKKQTAALKLENEFTLPTLASILLNKPNQEAIDLNLELLNFEDDLDTNDEDAMNTAEI